MCGNSFDSGRVFNAWGLKAGTSYTVSVTGGYSGNMISASRTITTNGSGWNTTTSTVSSGTTTNNTTTTVQYNDPSLYMARINSSNIVIDVCVCSVEWVRANPARYPGTWVQMWMGVNNKNYAGVGWTYDPVAENFYPPTTTTTSTTVGTSTNPGSPSTTASESSTNPGISTSGKSSPQSTLFVSGSTKTEDIQSGVAVAIVDGKEVKLLVTEDSSSVSATSGVVKLNLNTNNSVSPKKTTIGDQGMVLRSGESVGVAMSGLQPKSKVEAVLYSEPQLLGVLTVDTSGNLNTSVKIPSNIEAGSHTIVLTGTDKFGSPIVMKLGLIIYANGGSHIPIWMWVILGLLSASLVLALKKKIKVPTASN
jgi:hypothetical protein